MDKVVKVMGLDHLYILYLNVHYYVNFIHYGEGMDKVVKINRFRPSMYTLSKRTLLCQLYTLW